MWACGRPPRRRLHRTHWDVAHRIRAPGFAMRAFLIRTRATSSLGHSLPSPCRSCVPRARASDQDNLSSLPLEPDRSLAHKSWGVPRGHPLPCSADHSPNLPPPDERVCSDLLSPYSQLSGWAAVTGGRSLCTKVPAQSLSARSCLLPHRSVTLRRLVAHSHYQESGYSVELKRRGLGNMHSCRYCRGALTSTIEFRLHRSSHCRAVKGKRRQSCGQRT
jgi:hypothetical protein